MGVFCSLPPKIQFRTNLDYRVQTTDTNQGQTHCIALWAPILDLRLENTKSSKFAFQGFISITKIWSLIPTSLEAKLAQEGKHVGVGARQGFPYRSVKLVLLANGNGVRLIPICFTEVVKRSIHVKYRPGSTQTFLDTNSDL